MPWETINQPRNPATKKLVIGWNKIGWVQASIYPPHSENSGDAYIVDLQPLAVDRLIKTLKRAKRQAYRAGARHWGYTDGDTPGGSATPPQTESTPPPSA